jgi:hypothetical protein
MTFNKDCRCLRAASQFMSRRRSKRYKRFANLKWLVFEYLNAYKVKSWSLGFQIATLTELSQTSAALKVGRLQIRTTRGAAHTGIRRISPLAPTPAASLATRRFCSRTGNVNPQPKLVPIHRRRSLTYGQLRLTSQMFTFWAVFRHRIRIPSASLRLIIWLIILQADQEILQRHWIENLRMNSHIKWGCCPEPRVRLSYVERHRSSSICLPREATVN